MQHAKVDQIYTIFVMNIDTMKVVANNEVLFNKPASGVKYIV
jgi:hypothetical protein